MADTYYDLTAYKSNFLKGTASGSDQTLNRNDLGATTVGNSLFTLANPSAITFLRVNADNTVSTLSAGAFITALGLGTISTQAANSVSISGGAINGTSVGATTPSTGAFTTLASSSTAALGTITSTGSITTTGNTSIVGWSDVSITRGAANVLEQKSGTTAQALKVYNTFTDTSNYERGTFDFTTNTNVLSVGTQNLGTSTARATYLGGTTLKLLPNGLSSTTGQVTISAAGDTVITSNTSNGTTSNTGALQIVGGVGVGGGMFVTSFFVVAAAAPISFFGRGGLRSNADGDFSFRNNANGANGSISIAGMSSSIVSKITTYTALSTDFTILGDATSAAFSVTLPTAASSSGKLYNIKKIDSGGNAVTIQANGAELIDGANTKVISTQWVNVRIQSNGTSWFTL